jgi:chitinase
MFSPYKDITAGYNQGDNSMNSFGQAVTSAMPARNSTLTWAFATGVCGSENWAGLTPAQVSTNVARFVSAGKKYIISTGGAAGAFTCTTDAGFDSFISHYNSANLVGIDFDIEYAQTLADNLALVARVKAAQTKYPNLRFTFTIATLATSQSGSSVAVNMGASSPNPLGYEGNLVMQAIQQGGLTNYFINLMTMDYGPPSAGNCVVSGGQCQMGQSAIQAAMDFHGFFNVPFNHIELTPMSGANDVAGETFTTGDVSTMSSWAKANGIPGVHYWSFDRDSGLSYDNAFISSLGL